MIDIDWLADWMNNFRSKTFHKSEKFFFAFRDLSDYKYSTLFLNFLYIREGFKTTWKQKKWKKTLPQYFKNY